MYNMAKKFKSVLSKIYSAIERGGMRTAADRLDLMGYKEEALFIRENYLK